MIWQLADYFNKARILFVKQGCDNCLIWKRFVEAFNLEIEVGKRINVVDVTLADKYGAPLHPLLELFENNFPHLMQKLPVLFFDGNCITGAHTKEEAEAFILSALRKDFIIAKDNPYIFEPQCEYVKKGILGKKTLVC